MILGLSGEKESGKDTVAAYLVKQHGFERKAFADPLKRSIAALFDVPFHTIDKMKLNPNIRVAIIDHQIPMFGPPQTFRQFLQRYGTESHRDVFGDDFWLDYTLPVQGFYGGRAIVITDCRFANEVNRIRSLGGSIARIYRESAPRNENQHRSELFDFEADYVIHNDGTLDELYERVEQVIVGAALWQEAGNSGDLREVPHISS